MDRRIIQRLPKKVANLAKGDFNKRFPNVKKKKEVPVAHVLLPPPVVNVQETVSWTKDSDLQEPFRNYLQMQSVKVCSTSTNSYCLPF